MKAWRVTDCTNSDLEFVVAALTRSQAKWHIHSNKEDAGYKSSIVDFHAKRAPEFDTPVERWPRTLGWKDKTDSYGVLDERTRMV